jgi:hypothetical protein
MFNIELDNFGPLAGQLHANYPIGRSRLRDTELEDLFLRVEAGVFANRSKPATNAELRLRSIDQVDYYANQRGRGRGNRQTKHPDRCGVPPVLANFVSQEYPNSAADRSLGDRQERRRRERKNNGLIIIARHKTVLLC